MLNARIYSIPKVTLLVFCRVRCGTLNSDQSKECDNVMEFPLLRFNVLKALRDVQVIFCIVAFSLMRFNIVPISHPGLCQGSVYLI